MPLFVRLRTPVFGPSGTTIGAYLAALIDRPDLASTDVLGIGGNADLLLGVVNRTVDVASYTAVEPDLVTAAFFSSHLRDVDHVDLVTTDLVDATDATLESLAGAAPFDLVVVRHHAGDLNAGRLVAILGALRGVVTPTASLVVSVALDRTTVAGKGAGDVLHDRGVVVDGYLDYEYELGTIPVYTLEHVTKLAAECGWSVGDVYEPGHGFTQHHLVLSPAP